MDRRVQPPLRHRPIASGEYRTVELVVVFEAQRKISEEVLL